MRFRLAAIALVCLQSASLARAAPIVNVETPSADADVDAINLAFVTSPSMSASRDSREALLETGIAAGVLPETLPLTAEPFDREQDAANAELDEYTAELFQILAIIQAQQEAELKRREAMEQNEEALENSSLMPMIIYARELVKNFILGEDSDTEVILLTDISSQAKDGQPGGVTATLAMESRPAATPDAGLQQLPVEGHANPGADKSFLHRLFCMVGLLEPEAVGLTEDCQYSGL